MPDHVMADQTTVADVRLGTGVRLGFGLNVGRFKQSSLVRHVGRVPRRRGITRRKYPTCGGTNVMRDAWAVWDVENQDWVLGAVFDAGHCDDCEAEKTLEERPVLVTHE